VKSPAWGLDISISPATVLLFFLLFLFHISKHNSREERLSDKEAGAGICSTSWHYGIRYLLCKRIINETFLSERLLLSRAFSEN
jgi:hypothetical protein